MASLGNDLAGIRKRLKFSLEDIHSFTKIPANILQAIEDDSIFTSLDENKTYIRSYVRSYGKALKLKDDLVVEALNQFETGDYTGWLLQGEAGAETQPASFDDEEIEKTEPEAEGMVHDHAPELPGEEKPTQNNHEKVPEPPSIGSVDWADMGRKFTPLQTKSRMWIGIIVILMIIVAVLFFWFYQNNPNLLSSIDGSAETSQSLLQPSIVPDSLQLNLTDAENTSPAVTTGSLQVLPDTLTMLIYAAYNKLEPVRVFTDVMDNLNPYWIERGEAFRFEFVNLIRLRGQYSRMELLLNGHPLENFYPRFYNPDIRMVEIERNVFEGDNKWLQPPPDSASLHFLPPSVVVDRPIFN